MRLCLLLMLAIRAISGFASRESRKSTLRLFMSSKSATVLDSNFAVSLQDALAVHGEPDVVFLDGSWWLPNSGISGRNDFEQGPRIAGAAFWDIDEIADKSTNLPHMMPSAALHAAAMDALDISNAHHIIVHGTKKCPYLHRTWYQLVCMGHDIEKVHMLQASVEDWIDAGGPTDASPAKALRAEDLETDKAPKYQANPAKNVVDKEYVKQIIAGVQNGIIVDVRSSERFMALINEPRPGLRLGHMPGAKNLFFQDLLDTATGQFKPVEQLKARFEEAGIDMNTDQKIVTSCGSGATACTLAAALIVCGRDPNGVAIYDGSWIEWGSDPDVPIVKD